MKGFPPSQQGSGRKGPASHASLSLDLGLTWEAPKSNPRPIVKSTRSTSLQELPVSRWNALGGSLSLKTSSPLSGSSNKAFAAAPTPGFHQNVYTTCIHAKEGAQQNIKWCFL